MVWTRPATSWICGQKFLPIHQFRIGLRGCFFLHSKQQKRRSRSGSCYRTRNRRHISRILPRKSFVRTCRTLAARPGGLGTQCDFSRGRDLLSRLDQGIARQLKTKMLSFRSNQPNSFHHQSSSPHEGHEAALCSTKGTASPHPSP